MNQSSIVSIGAHIEINRLAALLDMSVRWVKEQIKSGNLEGYRLGNRIVVSERDVNKFLQSRSMKLGTVEEPTDEPEAA